MLLPWAVVSGPLTPVSLMLKAMGLYDEGQVAPRSDRPPESASAQLPNSYSSSSSYDIQIPWCSIDTISHSSSFLLQTQSILLKVGPSFSCLASSPVDPILTQSFCPCLSSTPQVTFRPETPTCPNHVCLQTALFQSQCWKLLGLSPLTSGWPGSECLVTEGLSLCFCYSRSLSVEH